MAADGKQLEALVSFVEKTLLPQGFDVKTNERVYNDDGIQIAEFDVEIRGKVGSTSIAWLIECRDRPGDGPAPGSWVEQLVGRRTRFGFNKVTAVSTTGFATGAIEFAQSQGIELREVKGLNPEEFTGWLVVRNLQHIERVSGLRHATLLVGEEESEKRKRALLEIISSASGDATFLKSSKTSESISPASAFLAAVGGVRTLFDDLVPNGPEKNVHLHVTYANDEDHFVVETPIGAIRVQAIVFEGELRITKTLVPLTVTAEYRHAETGQPISQLAAFASQTIHGMKVSMEMHRMAESDETHIILRRVKDDA